jgi:hypothetical protein
VITSLHVQGLRGIREGRLGDLPSLAILMGPNGCGKSTVLEALLLGASNDVADAVGRCVARRLELPSGSAFLFANRGDPPKRSALIEILGEPGSEERSTHLKWYSGPKKGEPGDWVAHITSAVSRSSVNQWNGLTQFNHRNETGPSWTQDGVRVDVVFLRPTDRALPASLDGLVAEAFSLAHVDRHAAVEAWLASRPTPPAPSKEAMWSIMAGWFAAQGCEAFLQHGLWSDSAVKANILAAADRCGLLAMLTAVEA